MKSNLKKKTLSLLLAVCLALMLLPMTAGAASDIIIEGRTVNDDVHGNGSQPDGDLSWPLPEIETATGNSVTINNGGTVTGSVYGGIANSNTSNATATGNGVTINNGGMANGMIVIGGRAYSETGIATATDNSSTVNSVGTTTGTVQGGNAESTTSDATSTGNTVTINGGTVEYATGGQALTMDDGIATVTGNNATVNSGSTVTENVAGGIAITFGDAGTATTTGNTVTISGGSIGADVIGGWSQIWGANTGTGSATGNTVTISGSPTFSASTIYGGRVTDGYSPPGVLPGDATTGNRLELKTSELTVAGVQNFQFIDFYLPSGITNNSTMLTATTATDLTDVTVDLKFDSTAPTLAVGNTITLLNGVTGTPAFAGGSADFVIGGYAFTLSISGGNLIATAISTAPETIVYPTDFPPRTLRPDPIWSAPDSLFPYWLSGNSVTVNSGTIAGAVYGGISGTGENVMNNSVYINGGTVNMYVNGGVTNGTGSATYNSVTVTGGTLNDSVIGGRAIAGNATHNTVTISGTPVFAAGAEIQGGMAAGDQITANTLNVWNYNGSPVDEIQNFQYYNFILTASLKGLEVTGAVLGPALTVTGVSVQGGASLSIGQELVLIEAGAGIDNAPANTTVTTNGYTFSLSLSPDFKQLIATVTAVPLPTGGGSGGTANPSGSFSDGSAYVKGTETGLVFIIQKDFSQFSSVKVDNITLTQGQDYTAENSSTKITLLPDYLDTLQAGTHTLTVGFKDNTSAAAQFTVAQTVTPITPEMPVNPFTDVFGTDWFIDAVIYVNHNGLMTGTSTDPMLFSPNMTLTRGMVITVLWRMEGSPDDRIPAAAGGGQFTDVAEEAYYYQAVNWAAANGIVSGYGGGKFGPEDNITREQMAVILLNYEIYTDKIPRDILMDREFSDWNMISDWAKNAVNRLTIQSILSGKPGNLFDPKGSATRAEFATVLMRFLQAKYTD